MTTSNADHVMSGPVAASAAGISYRQLDHWARKGWVVPSVQKAAGKSSRRVYSAQDVLRLRILRHFAEASWSLQEVADQLADADLGGRFLIKTPNGMVAVADEVELVVAVCRPEMLSVFDLMEQADVVVEPPATQERNERRSA